MIFPTGKEIVRAVWFRIHKTLIEMVSIKINALVL